jgi:hypothetical protein
MHSYLQLDKPGQLFVTMNCIMFRDLSVNPRWVTKWLLLGKSKWETAEKHYVYCAGNCFGNLRNLQCFRSKMKDYSLLERKTRIQAVLRQEMRLFRTWPVLDERFALFKEQFTKPSAVASSWCCLADHALGRRGGPSGCLVTSTIAMLRMVMVLRSLIFGK